ncbi:hypothetical protein P170DRAFT_451614 [Aspergillus steynii IBT 23096]|uniref:TFG box profile domain-containing protein n=1 Tax=Aspergillus steynii IBT 23096 TaxID=1392250 RepID=A0A2I2FQ53_9EURO|nr:uncharacterized protein P170DRAFT_451614 [Aspergillus steynii IBT 23096]PLB42773.1 hypothetical protein P170DRAFT_451614 [Aspergillus steynii IBT 23096]
MDMNHLIGQRFNLISKSDIRYVGTLHEINPEASTIALENVVSFGTEGRRGNPAEEIPPSSSIYEYIVFRGSDVKDISVAEEKEAPQPEPPQVPDDPAILGSMSRPGPGPGQAQGPPGPPGPGPQGLPPHSQPPQQPGAPRPVPPGYPQPPQFQGFYPPYGQRFGAPGFPPGPGFPNMPYGAPPGWFPPSGSRLPPGSWPVPTSDAYRSSWSTSDTPSSAARTCPPTSLLSKPASRDATPGPGAPAQVAPTPPVESKPSGRGRTGICGTCPRPTRRTEQGPPTGPRNGRVQPAIPIAAPKAPAPRPRITEAYRAATAAVAAAMAKLPQPGPQQKSGAAPVDNLTRQMAEMKPYDGTRPQRGHHQHPRGGRGGQRTQYQGHKKVEDLLKEAIATGSPVHEVEPQFPDGDVSEVASAGGASDATPYNKSSSFFDNISSEARDREEGAGGRVGGREWRGEEEKRNIETFGQGSVDGYRGGYRGRGRGRGYGRGRGGYNRGYGGRGRGGGIRGGRNVSQSTGVPTQT